jgi:hypothetical protein
MDWEGLREKTLGEVANTLVTEGVGVGGGFIAASTVGRRIEDYMLGATVTEADTLTTKIKGWAYNNVPKLAGWYLIRKYVPETPETRTQEVLVDAKKAIAGSVVFDSLLRATNHGAPVHDPSGYKLLGGKGEPVRTAAPQADMQRLIQENSALRTELNKALQRLAAPAPAPQPVQVQAPAPQVHVAPQAPAPVVNIAPIQKAAPPAPVVRYQPAPAPVPVRTQAPPVVRVEQQQPVPPAVSERERRFAFMPTYHAPPEVVKREEKYGFAGKSSEKEIATMFGML